MAASKDKFGQLQTDEIVRRAWEGIAAYASGRDLDERSFNGLTQAFESSMAKLQFDPSADLPIDVPFGDVVEVVNYARRNGSTDEEATRYWAARYQPELRATLSWLCLPRKHADLGKQAGRFLGEHASGLMLSLDANEKFDPEDDDCAPVLLYRQLQLCASIMSPICKFLIDRISLYQEGEITLGEAIPIHICEREGCGNFTTIERKGRKRFCSSRCRALAYQGSRDDWNEYMQRYRKLKSRRNRKRGAA